MHIKAGRNYLLREGTMARIYATDGHGAFPVHGAYMLGAGERAPDSPPGWQSAVWKLDGSFMEDKESILDIVSPEEHPLKDSSGPEESGP